MTSDGGDKERRDSDGDGGLSLSLTEHLAELRTRIIRVLAVVFLTGAASLAYAREIYGFLMAPVLEALPEGGQSLVYTSGIEELNVLLKVGLYAGVFLAVPMALHQAWKFAAPGLLKSEKRFLLPFVALGTAFFLAGAAFCYAAVLPSMFSFLLSPGEEAATLSTSLSAARGFQTDALRLWELGEDARAADLSRAALSALKKDQVAEETATAEASSSSTPNQRAESIGPRAASAQGDVPSDRPAGTASEGGPSPSPPPADEAGLKLFMQGFDRLMEASIRRPNQDAGRSRAALESHVRALRSMQAGDWKHSAESLAESGGFLSGSTPGAQGAFAQLWRGEKALAEASADLSSHAWTRPMLTMREQLSLVLVLLVAFGLIFELPRVMAALAAMGVLKFRWVWAAQRYAIVGCVIASALITPTGDVINLSLMAVPMVVCFEAGVLLVFLLERKRKEGEAEEPADRG